MSNKLCHFEIPAEKPETIVKFYEEIFDWKIEKMPGDEMDYWVIHTGDVTGGIMPKTMPEMVQMNYICVESVEEQSKIIQDAGGKVVMAKTSVHGMGWFAVAIDPEGNCFGIWEEDKEASK